jgi:hypothetical protein
MGRMQRKLRILCVSFGLVVGIAGCVMYETAPGVYSAAPSSSFDRSWAAAVGAFADEGVQVTQHDRSTGTISGHLGDTLVTAVVLRQADGSVKVEFAVSGNVAANPSLNDRIVSSYNRRMGR